MIIKSFTLSTISVVLIPKNILSGSDGSVWIDSVSGGVPNYTYIWNTGDTVQNLINLSPGIYNVSIYDVNLCSVSSNFIGESQKGKKIPIIYIKKKNHNDEKKLKVWMQGGLHGNEPASTESLLYLIHLILEDSDYNYLLNKIEIFQHNLVRKTQQL